MMMRKGIVKTIGRQGCRVGELRSAIDGKCYKVLQTKPKMYMLNIRDKRTGKILSSSIPAGKNMFSHTLADAKDYSVDQDIVITLEKVLWDSKSDKPISGRYLYRDKDILKTGYVP